MKRISSKNNPIYKDAVKLLRKKYRDAEGKYLLEGIKPVRDALETGIVIETIFIKESEEEQRVFDADNVIVLSDDLFDGLSDTETTQGVIAVASKKESVFPEEGNVVILDRLQDPGNIGTIIRTAEAAGFAAVATLKGTGDVYSPKVVRAASGSLFRMQVIQGLDENEVKCLCTRTGRKLAVTALEGAQDFHETDLKDAAMVIGNEGSGVSESLMEAADIKVRIPMEGEIESLNAAVAAGILMYECMRQKAAAGKVK